MTLEKTQAVAFNKVRVSCVFAVVETQTASSQHSKKIPSNPFGAPPPLSLNKYISELLLGFSKSPRITARQGI